MDLQIDRKPMSRGVTHLMYVGDDDAVEKALDPGSRNELIAGAVAAVVALKTRGVTRLLAGGIAAIVGYRAFTALKKT